MCRFSSFAKTGGEAFLMGQVDVNVPESDRIKIVVRFRSGFCLHKTESTYLFCFFNTFYSCLLPLLGGKKIWHLQTNEARIALIFEHRFIMFTFYFLFYCHRS